LQGRCPNTTIRFRGRKWSRKGVRWMALMETYTRWPIVPTEGKGTRIWDKSGREYLDFTSGIGVVNIGHCHPHVVQRVERQLHALWHVSNLFPISAQEALARRLTEVSGLGAAFFCNSG